MTGTSQLGERGSARTVLLALAVSVAVALVAILVITRQKRAPAAQEPPAAPPRAARAGRQQTVRASAAPTARRSEERPSVNPDGYTSARVCGTCHVDIYSSWKNSLHAFSLNDPVFDTAYMQAVREGGEEAKRICLRCHAPITQINDDVELRHGVTAEGVTCDFCHTITAVDLANPERPFSVELGLVKRSVLRRATSPAHEVAYSELHATAQLCGGCHDYTASSGAKIMSTYEEWREGPYAAEDKPCQHCHMQRRAGNVVAAEVRSSSRKGFHQHDLIHDTDQLRSAVTVDVASVERKENDVAVEVEVTNVGSGHKVPTGIPSRQLVLLVTVTAGDRQVSQERRYRKVVADENGRQLSLDYEVLLHGSQIVFDNRLGPRERRREHFSFAPPGPGPLTVVAAVSYVYSPMVMDQRLINIELATAEKVLR